VEAKRYRCTVDPGEVDRLSAGSRRSLVKQGGPMSPAEVAAFEADPHHRNAVALRGWDDAGKVVGLTIAPFERYLPLLERVSIWPPERI
jgi:predicted HD phosphohydrolase